MEKMIILQGITVDQFMKQLESIVEEKISEAMEKLKPEKSTRFLTRKEVSDLLKISLPTLHGWIKLGWITSYKIGRRVLFKSSEIDESILNRKHKRFSI